MNVEELYQYVLDNPSKPISSSNNYRGVDLEAIKTSGLFEPGAARGSWKPKGKVKYRGEYIDKPYNAWFPKGELLGKKLSKGTQDVLGFMSSLPVFGGGGAPIKTSSKIANKVATKFPNLQNVRQSSGPFAGEFIPNTKRIWDRLSKVLQENVINIGQTTPMKQRIIHKGIESLKQYKKGADGLARLEATMPEFAKLFKGNVKKYDKWVDDLVKNTTEKIRLYKGENIPKGLVKGVDNVKGVANQTTGDVLVAEYAGPNSLRQVMNHEIDHVLHGKNMFDLFKRRGMFRTKDTMITYEPQTKY